MSLRTASSGAMMCRHCGRPIGAGTATWIGDAPYHFECTQPPSSVPFPYQLPPPISQRIPSFDETLGVDPTSKLAAAIDRLASALERLADKKAEG